MAADPIIDIQSLKNKIGADATALQDVASNPLHNVWVGASAGTGKTKVLTDRVLRLLLPIIGQNDGTDPSKILCITFTKAGASEMIARVMKILSHWAVCDEGELDQELTKLLGNTPSLKQRDKARRLFAQIVDMPEGLKITTIHAFCQSVLGRFPLEAGLSPQFKIIDESEASGLMKQARNNLITDIRTERASNEVREAFYNLATIKNGEQINELIQSILYDRQKIKSIKNTADHVFEYLNIDENDTRESIVQEFFKDKSIEEKIQNLATAFSYGAAKNQEKSIFLQSFLQLSMNEKIEKFHEYQSAFLTAKQDFYAEAHVSKGAKAHNENAPYIFMDEAARVKETVERLKSIAIAQSTKTLLIFAQDIIDRYETLKSLQNALDYDDLINCTRDLLHAKTNSGLPMSDWVLYKLDGGIDHILVDEAQDTNQAQWDIILKLSEDFFSGHGTRDADDVDRTLFVVGDEKQSIYRFQGAAPEAFETVRKDIHNRVMNAQKSFEDVPMNTSFRSVSAILDMVDTVFNQDKIRGSIADQSLHTAYRQGQSGCIDVWPLYQTPKTEDREPWQMPIEIRPSFDAKAALAERIALQIAAWIETREILTAHNRPIEVGDIMILVRRRNVFVEHLIRALKSKNIPVSGVDRMIVSDQIAVQDILAALSFAIMPDDDLTLATLLKSPFVGWDDDVLESYAYTRTHTLWDKVKKDAPVHVTVWLSNLIETMNRGSVFEAVNNILIQKTPNNGQTGWKAILSRLGIEAIDAVEEFLSKAQDFDFQNPSMGVQGFIHAMQSDKRALKREMETSAGMVKIMTVHASKGLQAPIVFLPDTCAMPRAAGLSDQGFIWTNESIPLWVESSDDMNDAYKAIRDDIKKADLDEYYRLLYVAMTRAEDRLVVCGYLPQKGGLPNGSWYDVVEKALPSLSFTKKAWDFDVEYCGAESHAFTFETQQTDEVLVSDKRVERTNEILPLPDWVHKEMAVEQHPPKTLMPSKMDEDDVPVRSPLMGKDESYRFQRGLLTHSLLQYLPDISPEKRSESAIYFMARQAPDLPTETQQSIITECLTILNDSQFSPFFGEDSLAEVPITGVVVNESTGKTDIISGQIDRMLVTDTDVWIVDYKSNRPPPRDSKDIPVQYKNQMRAYRTLIADIYPDRIIRTALLWTDGPFMMEIME